MAKIPHAAHRPNPHPPKPHREPFSPSAAQAPSPAPKAGKDSFLRNTLVQVYESNPLVMLCTKPDLRGLASKLPVVKEVADAVCPAIAEFDQTIKK